jgi:serine protease Do
MQTSTSSQTAGIARHTALRIAALALLAVTIVGCGQSTDPIVQRSRSEPTDHPTPLAGPSQEAAKRLATDRRAQDAGAHTAYRLPVDSVGEQSEPPQTQQYQEAISSAEVVSRSFREAARIVLPSVVTIQRTSHSSRAGDRSADAPLDDLFQRFFEDEQRPSRRQEIALGSGVIIDKSGIILTNAHVVGTGRGTVVIRLHDGRKFKAADIKTDTKTDLAVVRIRDAGDLPFAHLGNSDKLQIGDWVIAVGNPFGLSETVTAGIISAKQRGLGITAQEGFLQTDAAINPGNSGGPLVNLRGQVVGIATAISTTTGGYQGIGFAVPSNVARWVCEQLISKGAVTRAYLGVAIQELTPDLAKELGLDEQTTGVMVTRVYPDSPAKEAGLKTTDVITAFAGHRITNPQEFQAGVQQSPLDSRQTIAVLRKGKPLELTVVMREQPEDFGQLDRSEKNGEEER